MKKIKEKKVKIWVFIFPHRRHPGIAYIRPTVDEKMEALREGIKITTGEISYSLPKKK